MESLKKRLYSYVEKNKQEAIELFQSLIQIKSINHGYDFNQGNERDISDYIEEWLKPLNLDFNRVEPHPKRVNIAARKIGRKGKPVLCIYGHLDTVPAGDHSKWIFPPFEGRIHDGRIYGRGASDIKQGIASSLFAVKTIIESGVSLEGDLLLAYGAGEETIYPFGLKLMVENEMIEADFCLYPHGGFPDDPKMPFGITLGHRGNMDIRIRTIGRAGHMARKADAINAIEKMAPIINSISSMNITGPPHHVVPSGGTISVNMIEGGIKSNIIPPECSISIDCRFGPGITTNEIKEKIANMVKELEKKDPQLRVDVEYSQGFEASWTEPDHPFIEEIRRVYREFDSEREIMAVGGGHFSDSKFLRMAGIPTAMALAPRGSIKEHGGAGHQYNEYAGVREYVESIKMQISLIVNLLT
jgi:succinyl-diaminopimelate desuccinylase